MWWDEGNFIASFKCFHDGLESCLHGGHYRLHNYIQHKFYLMQVQPLVCYWCYSLCVHCTIIINPGPAVSLSFAIGAIACVFTALLLLIQVQLCPSRLLLVL